MLFKLTYQVWGIKEVLLAVFWMLFYMRKSDNSDEKYVINSDFNDTDRIFYFGLNKGKVT